MLSTPGETASIMTDRTCMYPSYYIGISELTSRGRYTEADLDHFGSWGSKQSTATQPLSFLNQMGRDVNLVYLLLWARGRRNPTDSD